MKQTTMNENHSTTIFSHIYQLGTKDLTSLQHNNKAQYYLEGFKDEPYISMVI